MLISLQSHAQSVPPSGGETEPAKNQASGGDAIELEIERIAYQFLTAGESLSKKAELELKAQILKYFSPVVRVVNVSEGPDQIRGHLARPFIQTGTDEFHPIFIINREPWSQLDEGDKQGLIMRMHAVIESLKPEGADELILRNARVILKK